MSFFLPPNHTRPFLSIAPRTSSPTAATSCAALPETSFIITLPGFLQLSSNPIRQAGRCSAILRPGGVYLLSASRPSRVIYSNVVLISSGGATVRVIKVVSTLGRERDRQRERERAPSTTLSSMTTNCYEGFGFGFSRAYTTAAPAQTKALRPVGFALLQKMTFAIYYFYCLSLNSKQIFYFFFFNGSIMSVIRLGFPLKKLITYLNCFLRGEEGGGGVSRLNHFLIWQRFRCDRKARRRRSLIINQELIL